MDFGKFRDTAELADITVCVEGRDFRLHRFPLYVRSDFFRALARNSLATDGERVELADFPGGADTFELVTSFCYNIDVDVTTKNVCQLRCAAEFLQVLEICLHRWLISKDDIIYEKLFFLLFPLCRGEADLLVTAKYRYFRDLLPSVPVFGLFSPFFFLLCLSQISLPPVLPS